MAVLNILRYPDARLHKLAAPVTVFDEGLKKLVADMTETMYSAPGIGLAATQVDVHKQVIVVDVSERRDSLVVLVNHWAASGKRDVLGALLGMGLRMAAALAGALLVAELWPELQRSGFLWWLSAFYLVALVIETRLSMPAPAARVPAGTACGEEHGGAVVGPLQNK